MDKTNLFQLNKRIFIIVVFTIIGIMTTILLLLFKGNTSNPSENNSIQINHLTKIINEADSLRNSDPDSAVCIYTKVISLLQNSKEKGYLQQLANSHLGMANSWIDKGDYVQSLKHDSIALNIALAIEDGTIKAKAISVRGNALNKMGEYENAMSCCKDAMKLAVELKDKGLQSRIYSTMAIIYFNQGNIPKTIEGFNKALEMGKEIKMQTLVASNYMNLATVYDHQSQNDSVLVFNKLALNSFQESNDKIGQIMCSRNIGNHYYTVSDFGKAVEYYLLSVNLAQAIDDKPDLAKNYNNLAEVYIHLGDNDSATDFLFKSIKIKESLGDKLSLAKGYSGLARIYFGRKEYSRALIYFKKALAIGREFKNTNQIGSSLSSIGSVFSNEGQQDSAISYYNKSLEIYKTIDFKYGISNVCINLGDEYRIKKDYTRAEALLLEALRAKKESQEEEGQAVVYSQLANLYLSMSEGTEQPTKVLLLNKAEKVGLQGYQTAKHLSALPVMKDAAGVLKHVFKEQGRYEESLKYSETCNSLSDSILNEEKVQALAFAEARWNAEKKQQEIDYLENTQKLQQEIIQQKVTEAGLQKLIIWIIGALFILTLASAGIVTLYLRKRKDTQYQKQLSKMTALRMQNARNTMSPHFFFNLLASLSGLSNDPEGLKSKLKSLSLLLRKVIENIDRTAITLEEELSAVKAYIDLYGDKIPAPFNVEYLIAQDTKLQELIPAMLIQIPVENAIKHGLMPLEGEKKLTISVTAFDGYQQITVSDNGIGLKASAGKSTGTGTGLKVLMQTIHLMNAGNQEKIKFSVIERQSTMTDISGTIVEIKIPNQFNYTI